MRPALTTNDKQSIIINRCQKFSFMYGVITPTTTAMNEVVRLVKNGLATKLVDNEDTLMYTLKN